MWEGGVWGAGGVQRKGGREERGVNGLVVDSEESHGFPLGVKYANRTYRTREAT